VKDKERRILEEEEKEEEPTQNKIGGKYYSSN
jgi:hypothetical protein